MRNTAALVVLGLALGFGSPAVAGPERPVSGKVEEINSSARTIVVGGETYYAPSGIDLSGIHEGQSIILHWENRGGRMTLIEIEEREVQG